MCKVINILILLSLLNSTSVNAGKIRPLSLEIKDPENMTPISQIVVYYQLITSGVRHFLGFPIIDPAVFKERVKECYTSDQRGIVTIEKRRISYRLYEKPFEERIYINVDSSLIDREHLLKIRANSLDFFDGSPTFYNPNSSYHGTLVRTWTKPFDRYEKSTDGLISSRNICVDIKLIDSSLSKSSDSIIVFLKRKDSYHCEEEEEIGE